MKSVNLLVTLGVVICVGMLAVVPVSMYISLKLTPTNSERMEQFAGGIHYFRDKRTNVCFAVTDSLGINIAAVPCEKVNHLLPEGQRDPNIPHP